MKYTARLPFVSSRKYLVLIWLVFLHGSLLAQNYGAPPNSLKDSPAKLGGGAAPSQPLQDQAGGTNPAKGNLADPGGAAKNLLAIQPPPIAVAEISRIRVLEMRRYPTLAFGFECVTGNHSINKIIECFNSQPKVSSPEITTNPPLLSGGGEIILTVDEKLFRSLQERQTSKTLQATTRTANPDLYINGFNLGPDATLVSKEVNGTNLQLRFRIVPGIHSKPLWASVYQEGGLTEIIEMRLSAGWNNEINFASRDEKNKNGIRVSTPSAVLSAFALTFLSIIFFVWSLRWTDTFRVGRVDEWWNEAASLRNRLRPSYRGHLRYFGTRNPDSEITQLAESIINERSAIPQRRSLGEYLIAAERALNGDAPQTPDETRSAIIGLALRGRAWVPVRRQYSLTRLQIGTWTLFATTAALFLWIVYGSFPVLETSTLSLVLITTATATASFLADNDRDNEDGAFSKGILRDITTGWDGTQYIHRYQAIIVNALLLVVGVVNVVQNLSYPTFDPSWLQFLGLSGVAQAVGKKFIENTHNIPPEQTSSLDKNLLSSSLPAIKPGRTL